MNVIAVAVRGSTDAPCILLLEPNDIGLIDNSNAALVSNCGLRVNSGNPEAIYVNSNSHITASSVCVTGYARLNSGATITPDAIEGCAPFADPLANIPEPAEAAWPCDYDDFELDGGIHTMSPGVYCDKVTINNFADVTLDP